MKSNHIRWHRNIIWAASLLGTLLVPELPSPRAQWLLSSTGAADANSLACDSAMQVLFQVTNHWTPWRSTDAGATWMGLRSRIYSRREIRVFGVRALDAGCDTVFTYGVDIGGFVGRHAWSFDGGETWQSLTGSFVRSGTHNFLEVWQARHDVWFFLGPNGHFAVSSNFGRTWVDRTPFHQFCEPRGLYQDPVSDSTLFAYGTYDYSDELGAYCGGIQRSTDLGQTWVSILPLHDMGYTWALIEDIARLSNGDLITLIYNSEPWWDTENVFISTDDGETWTRINGGLTERFRPCEVVEDTTEPGTVFLAGASRYGLYWSHDYGRTWVRCLNGLPPNNANFENLFQHPSNGAIYVAVWGYGEFRTTTHGNSWEALPAPPVEEAGDLGCVNGAILQRGRLSNRNWRWDDSEDGWLEICPPGAADTIVRMDMPAWVCGDTLVTALRKRPYGPATDLFQITSTTDAGGSWTTGPFLALYPNHTGIERMEAQTLNGQPHLLVFVPPTALLYVSSDRGQSWEARPYPQETPFYYRDWTHNHEAFCLVESDNVGASRIYRSSDLGATWVDLAYPGSYLYGTGTIALLGPELFVKTEEREQSRCLHWADNQWDERGLVPDTAYMTDVFAVCEAETLLVGISLSNLVWISRDLGYTWNSRRYEIPYGPENYGLQDAVYDSAGGRIWASTFAGTCYLDLAQLNAAEPLRFRAVAHEVFTVHPNPFNSRTRLSLYLSKQTPIRLEIYDLQGRLVTRLLDEVRPAGRHEVVLDMTRHASGIYFAHLGMPDQSHAAKLVVIK